MFSIPDFTAAWSSMIKQRIVSVCKRMALSANWELIQFYWDLGALIAKGCLLEQLISLS